MTERVLCLRPEVDFLRVGVGAPPALVVDYRDPSDAGLATLMREASALLIPAVGSKLPPALFASTRLRLVQITGTGADRLDRDAMVKAGIPVANVPGGSNSAVAEYVVTTAAALSRRFFWSDQEIRAGNYAAFRARMVVENVGGLEGLTIGLIGFGAIGLAVGRAFHALGCRIFYYDPAVADPKSGTAIGAEAMSLDGLLSTADVVSVHVPLLPTTVSLLGTRELSLMKTGAILIQASRGGVVDEAALARALASGHLGGAAVDVYATEPPTPENPLLALSGEGARRLILTPHIGGVTRQSWAFIFRSAWQNIERVLRGEAPINRVY
jgi:phosphoglycerate dehydrogenase-like enzyme